MSTLTEHFEDESEGDESHKDHIEFVESREDSTIAFQTPKQSLHFVSLFIHLLVVLPRINTAFLRRRYRLHSHFHCLLAVRIAFIRSIHQQRNSCQTTSSPPARRAHSPATARTSLLGDHWQQPYESWYSSLRWIFRWTAGRFF